MRKPGNCGSYVSDFSVDNVRQFRQTWPNKNFAFIAEVAISCALVLTVLFASNHKKLSRYKPYFVGTLYVIFITLETFLSGMSMNPARTFDSAVPGRYWHALWIYFLAPTLSMLLAAEIFLWVYRGIGPYCAKLHHDIDKRYIFCRGTQQAHSKEATKHETAEQHHEIGLQSVELCRVPA